MFLLDFVIVGLLIALSLEIIILRVLSPSLSWIFVLQDSGDCVIEKWQERFFSFLHDSNQKTGRINDTNIASIVHGFSIDNLLNDFIAFD